MITIMWESEMRYWNTKISMVQIIVQSMKTTDRPNINDSTDYYDML